MSAITLERNAVVNCPDCHRECGWCSWYAKNARAAGCGNYPSPTGRRSRKKCEWGQSLKGTTCPVCGGAGKLRLVSATYERIDAEAK